MIEQLWRTRADMHRAGIAHNDMHGDNIFWDEENETASVIDMGMGQNHPVAALMEALGGYTGLSEKEQGALAEYIKDAGNDEEEHQMRQEWFGDNIEQSRFFDRQFAGDAEYEDGLGNLGLGSKDLISKISGGYGNVQKKLREVLGKNNANKFRTANPRFNHKDLDTWKDLLGGEDEVKGLIDMFYSGLIDDDTDSPISAKDRMSQALDSIVGDRKRADVTGRGLQGRPLVPDSALEHDD